MPIVMNPSTQRPTKPVPDEGTPLVWRDGGDIVLPEGVAVVVVTMMSVDKQFQVVVAAALALLAVAEMEVVAA